MIKFWKQFWRALSSMFNILETLAAIGEAEVEGFAKQRERDRAKSARTRRSK